ncbi:MAG: NUDIX domain-containing protein [Rhodospirillales bacterium]|nr:NUDIX domain-containing protein [Rhodospirillales bacterium]
MANPQNCRAYGVLIRNGQVLVSAEHIAGVPVEKYPGGGVEPGETAAEAVVREYREETGLAIRILAELHDPGTMISPLTGRPYTPVYFLIDAEGEPAVPDCEPIAIGFVDPARVFASDRVAQPEKTALRLALAREAAREEAREEAREAD